MGSGSWALAPGCALTIRCPDEIWLGVECALSAGLSAAGIGLVRTAERADVEVSGAPPSPSQDYTLEIATEGIRLSGGGYLYGARTLGQMFRAAAYHHAPRILPSLRIEDSPTFPLRGIMLDISRDRVPKLSELEARIELAAELKYNHIQLYTEHTFAYRGHETVWEAADPLTPEDIRHLDRFAALRGIELCPNQNSFGHMHRWLRHPEYLPLAEAPEGIVHAFSPQPEPFGLCPTDAASSTFLAGLYDQLLPCFSSQRFNVGLDETIDLGLGRSKAACDRRGKHEVYLDFLLQVHDLVQQRGSSMLYWADIALAYPEVHSRLPQGATPIIWGYEDGHPFAEQAATLIAAGQKPWVCPGTSSWQGFTGRIQNAEANLRQASEAGRSHDCEGYLVSDWGDYGHWQPHPISLPGWILGAGQAWSPLTLPATLGDALNVQVLQDPSGILGQALVDLGHAQRSLDSKAENGIAIFFHLRYAHQALPIERAPGLSPQGCGRFAEALDAALTDLGQARPQGQGAGLLLDELSWAADTSQWASRFCAARLACGPGSHPHDIERGQARTLQAELGPLIDRHQALWLARCRPGGLDDSCDKLSRVASLMDGPL